MFLVMGVIFVLSHQPGDTLFPYLPAFLSADKICLDYIWSAGLGRDVGFWARKRGGFC
jgi:hypothetical protein